MSSLSPLRDRALIPLSRHHQTGLEITVLIDRGLQSEPTEEKVARITRKVIRLSEKDLFEHFRLEESVLFPAVRPILDSGDLVDSLVAGHRAMEDLVRRIREASHRERIPLLLRFAAFLRSHIRVEERQLFRQIQARLDKAQLEKLGGQIAEAIEAARAERQAAAAAACGHQADH